MSMEEYFRNAKNAEALLFVNIGDNALNAKWSKAFLFVNMGEYSSKVYTLNAKSAEALLPYL